MLEIFLPFLLAGFGMVLAGLLLDSVQHWSVFKACPEIFILGPSMSIYFAIYPYSTSICADFIQTFALSMLKLKCLYPVMLLAVGLGGL